MRRYCILAAALALAAVVSSTTIPPNQACIDNCKCKETLPSILQVVECDKPLKLDVNTFKSLNRKVINIISFEGVIIDEFHANAFDGFTTLEDVVMKKCQFGGIDANVFDNVKKLKFQDCAFEDNPDFSSNSLGEVHFGSCRLETVPALDQLPSLTFLNLSGNYIRDIEITAFAQLFDLEELILSNNEITKLSANLFVNNDKLNSLYLDNNPLKYFYINTTNNLETLSLKNCMLTTFDERSTYHLTMLSELNLNNNHIRTLSGKDFAHMNQLAVVDLTNNSLVRLEDDIFSGNPYLQKVILDDNAFETLPNFTVQNSTFEIYFFSCNNCKLKSLHKNTFKNMPAIVRLELARNNFTNVENMFDFIPSLRMLDISYNQIKTIGPKSLVANVNLESINLSGNPLMELDRDVFANHHAIKKIDTSETGLNDSWTGYESVLDPINKLLADKDEDEDDDEDEDEDDDNMIDNGKSTYVTENDEDEDDYYDYDSDSAYDDADHKDEDKITAEIVEDENINLARASYILSVTSVFVLTALVVLTAAVTITLCVLRRNSNFNMHKANLPRLKIPLWDANPSQKKHSGSIYRPLSEDLSGPKTPKLSRYDFNATPTVHTTNP